MTLTEQVDALLTPETLDYCDYYCRELIRVAQRIDCALENAARCQSCDKLISRGMNNSRKLCQKCCPHQSVVDTTTGDDYCRDCGLVW